jgi:hypothetical protein
MLACDAGDPDSIPGRDHVEDEDDLGQGSSKYIHAWFHAFF